MMLFTTSYSQASFQVPRHCRPQGSGESARENRQWQMDHARQPGSGVTHYRRRQHPHDHLPFYTDVEQAGPVRDGYGKASEDERINVNQGF